MIGGSNPERDQTANFELESVRYVQQDLAPIHAEMVYIVEHPILLADPPLRVLDVGCGPGHILQATLEAFGGSTGIGVEPSAHSVRLLDERYASEPRLSFASASAHDLPFPTDSFDLVICWSVLHWIGRNEYLQALGEMVRVCRRHLLVMDFTANREYRVPYQHDERSFTYKTDFTLPILASGVMSLEDDQLWFVDDLMARHPLEPADLQPFIGNPTSYRARRASLFKKDYSRLPIHTEGDFAP